MILAFTGHRPHKVGQLREPVMHALLAKLRELKPERCISGMALGVDQWAAACCIYLGIPLTAAVPFEEQDALWSPRDRECYKFLLRHATEVVYTNTYYTGKSVEARDLLLWRNEWMVDHCDELLAVWDGSKGGTFQCVKYARLMGTTIHYIDPNKLGNDQTGRA